MRLARHGWRNRNDAVVDAEAARDAAKRDAGFDHRLRQFRVAVRHDFPIDGQRAVTCAREGRVALEAKRPSVGDVLAGVARQVDHEGAGAAVGGRKTGSAESAAELPELRVGGGREQKANRVTKAQPRAPRGGGGNGGRSRLLWDFVGRASRCGREGDGQQKGKSGSWFHGRVGRLVEQFDAADFFCPVEGLVPEVAGEGLGACVTRA